MRIRSTVGIVPLFAVEVLEQEVIDRLPGFKKRMDWFVQNRPDLARCISYAEHIGQNGYRLLAIPSRERLVRVLRYVLDENELLSPYGIRSLSRYHRDHPYVMNIEGGSYEVHYTPGESDSGLFGGNSNWRGPVWLPLNYLLVEALKRYYHFYGDELVVECPTGSGVQMNLAQVSEELERRLVKLFVADRDRRPCHGDSARYAEDPAFRDLVLFYEYFHGDDGRGLGASHQTGWTALAGNLVERVALSRSQSPHPRSPRHLNRR